VCLRHPFGHRPPDTTQRFAGRYGSQGRGALDIGRGDSPLRASARHQHQIDMALLCQGSYCRCRFDLTRPGGRWLGLRRRRRRRGRCEMTDYSAAIGMHTVLEFYQRIAHAQARTRLDQQPSDMTGVRRGYVDHRFVGFDRHQRLIGDDMIAGGDVPDDDLGFLQAFAEIG
jgi:hypothetical protein